MPTPEATPRNAIGGESGFHVELATKSGSLGRGPGHERLELCRVEALSAFVEELAEIRGFLCDSHRDARRAASTAIAVRVQVRFMVSPLCGLGSGARDCACDSLRNESMERVPSRYPQN